MFGASLGLGLFMSNIVFGVEDSDDAVLPSDTTSLPNSCIDLPDGKHYLKLLEGDEYPIILATCSNGYTLIDYSSDSDWSLYFTSFLKWHYAIGGASQSDHYNWAEWYVPDDLNTNYIISPSCDVCDEEAQSSIRNTNSEYKSGYYMTANLYGCFVYPRGMPNCDFDINTYECKACYTNNFAEMRTVDWDDDDMTDTGACMTWIRGAYDEVDRTFDECTDASDNGFKPTIGLKGEFCVCTKPSTSQYISITQDEITNKKESFITQSTTKEEEIAEQERLDSAKAEDKTFRLYQKDFEDGTYRIQEPGTYIIMEDIIFDFNSGESDAPNAPGAWFPNEDDEKYPGYGTTREQFFMGFFAGITIECNNVVLDLGGHELKQSKEFFYQQGFFSTIEIESQPFIPGQGVGFFGSDPFFPENVIIRNGFLGRTSHHCLHGNYNKNLLIEDISCYDFSTHGIQLNGFDGVTIRNVDIGPSNTEQYLASEYTHYRFLLERLRKIADKNPTGTIAFDGRDPMTMSEITERLELQMTLAYKYVMYGEEYSDDHELYDDFVDAKKIFVNDNGLGYGASQYGLFLSYPGANVLSFHLADARANDITIENVKIHDLSHKTKEYAGIRTDLRLFVNSFNAPLHLNYLLGDEQWLNMKNSGENAQFSADLKYVGNALTDATFAMTELNDDWGLNQILFVLTNELTAWAKGEIDGTFNGKGAELLCSVDGMIHSVKGTFGLRIDGVDNVNIDGLYVSNIEESATLGYNICGECDRCAFESRLPYSYKYAGNWVHGISIDYSTPLTMKNVYVSNIESYTGRANGITIWPGVEAEFFGEISVSNIAAGRYINFNKIEKWEKTYGVPAACGIQNYEEDWGYSSEDDDKDISTISYDDDVKISVSCIDAGIGCWNNELYTMHGDTYSCDGEKDDGIAKSSKKSIQVEALAQKSLNKEGTRSRYSNSNSNSKSKLNLSTNSHSHFNLILFGIIGFTFVYSIVYITKYWKNDNKQAISTPNEVTPLML